MSAEAPHAISWNLTSRCNLHCDHCYLDAGARSGERDLPLEDCLRIVGELAAVNPRLLLILTGGEPLLRPDLGAICRAAAGAGMTVVVGTNGTALSRGEALRLKECGVSGVGVSLDAAEHPEAHDRFRRCAGSFERALEGIRAGQDAGLDVLVQTSVFAWNREELPAIAELSAGLGARAWNVYFLVCTGRGQGLTDLEPREYEATLRDLRRIQRATAGRLHVAVRCAPHFRRIVAEDGAPSFHAYPSGCPAGIHYARIGPRGEVTPCPYMPLPAGRLAGQSFREVWEESPVLAQLRDRRSLGGRCGICSYRDTCGGCRARALASLGDPNAEDPSCAHQPGEAREAPRPPEATFALPVESRMTWSEEARARLERVPSFVRGFVVRQVEEEARRRGLAEVTPEVMQAVRENAMPFMPPAPGAARPWVRGGPDPLESSPATREAGPEEARAATGAAGTAPESLAVSRREPPATVPWSPEALGRVENAPAFVRPGIRKLTELRARELGIGLITSEFLSEIRDESMMRVAQIVRRFGLAELDPEAFAIARRRLARDEKRLEVLDQLDEFLRNKGSRNEGIRRKFQLFIDSVPRSGRPWMPDATARIEQLSPPLRDEARRAAEQEAARLRVPVITRGVVDSALGNLSGACAAQTPDVAADPPDERTAD